MGASGAIQQQQSDYVFFIQELQCIFFISAMI